MLERSLPWIVCCGILTMSGCNCGQAVEVDAGAGVDAGDPMDGGSTDAGVPDSGAPDALDAGPAEEEASEFANGNDGWTITGDAQVSTVAPDFDVDGGFISAKDDVTGGVWYFVAPAKYLGDNRPLIGRWLKFDLRVAATPTSPFNAIDVKLVGGDGGLVLAYDTPTNPVGGAWTTYAVPLSAPGWKVGGLTDAGASDADFEQVMAHLTALWIRGEYNTGPDTGYLDNVRWGTSE